MIREIIRERMRKKRITQRELCSSTGIEYTAFNTFINNHKGLRYERVQSALDYLNIIPKCPCGITADSIRKSVWLEMKVQDKSVASIAKEIHKPYTSVWVFIKGGGSMPLSDVESLLENLKIELIPDDDRHREDRQD